MVIFAGLNISAQTVVIFEIMYHPASENPQEQWLEIQNSGSLDVSLTGWRVSNGINFDFPADTLLPAES